MAGKSGSHVLTGFRDWIFERYLRSTPQLGAVSAGTDRLSVQENEPFLQHNKLILSGQCRKCRKKSVI
jgi:hypothetical protein